MSLLPLFLKLGGRPVVVVGAGPVASSKLDALLHAGAKVTVVAPECHASIERASAAGAVTLVRRGFMAADLDGAWLAVAAAPPEINQQVALAAEERRIFVNAVDDPQRASAYMGAVLQREGLTVALSSDGLAPALVGLLREALDAVLPAELAAWLAVAQAQRGALRAAGVPLCERRPLLLRALNRLYQEERVSP